MEDVERTSDYEFEAYLESEEEESKALGGKQSDDEFENKETLQA